MDKAKDTSPSTSSKSELFIITPEELQKLGLLKGASLCCASPKTSKSQTEGEQQCEGANFLEKPNNSEVSEKCFKKDVCQNLPTLPSYSVTSQDILEEATTKPEILNSKVCLRITSDVDSLVSTDMTRIKKSSLASPEDRKIDKETTLMLDNTEMYKNIKVYKKGNKSRESSNAKDDKGTPSSENTNLCSDSKQTQAKLKVLRSESSKEDHLKEAIVDDLANKNSSIVITKILLSDTGEGNTKINSKQKQSRQTDESGVVVVKNKELSDNTSKIEDEATVSSDTSSGQIQVLIEASEATICRTQDIISESTENSFSAVSSTTNILQNKPNSDMFPKVISNEGFSIDKVGERQNSSKIISNNGNKQIKSMDESSVAIIPNEDKSLNKSTKCNDDDEEEILDRKNPEKALENATVENYIQKSISPSINVTSTDCVQGVSDITKTIHSIDDSISTKATEEDKSTTNEIIKSLDNVSAALVTKIQEDLQTSEFATSLINTEISTKIKNVHKEIQQSEVIVDLPIEIVGIKDMEQSQIVHNPVIVPTQEGAELKSINDGAEKTNKLNGKSSAVVAEEQISTISESTELISTGITKEKNNKIVKVSDKPQNLKENNEIPQTFQNDKNVPLDQKVTYNESSFSCPKKRGRKKKVVTTDVIECSNSFINQTCEAEKQLNKQQHSEISESCEGHTESQETNAIKKRGRKKKIKQSDSIMDEAKIENIPEIKVPKKRGRKRKADIMKSEPDNLFANEISVQDVIVKESEIKIPRKRGRPRKQPVDKVDQSQQNMPKEQFNEQESPDILEESKTGRKRRKVDYFAMENNLYELEMSNLNDRRNKSQSFSSDDEEIQMIEKIFNKEKISGRKSSEKLERNIDTVQSSSSDDEPLIKKRKLQKNTLSNENYSVIDFEDNKEISVVNGADKTPNAKYKKTGETVKLMKSMFSAAFKITPKIEIEDTAEKLDISSEVEHNTKRGRPKKDEEPLVNVDNDGNVNCAVCGERMENAAWKDHNMREHYNLSWREGEPPLDMDKDSFLRKTLKSALLKYKELRCKKCNYNSNLLNDFIEHREGCLGIVAGGNVTCAVCNIEIEKKKWIWHKLRMHNNLAWRVGDKPLNLNNQNFVLSVLNALYKAKKPLYCCKCGTSKKSVVGFLSHQAQCGIKEEEAKIKCEFCTKMVLPVSMPTHVKMIHETPQKARVAAASFEDSIIESGLRKRKAALDAMLVIDAFTREKIEQEQKRFYVDNLDFKEDGNFVREPLEQELEAYKTVKCKFRDCRYQTEDLDVFLDHMNNCGSKPNQYYTCLRCVLVTLTEKDMRDHVRTAHKSELDINIDSKHTEYELDEKEELLYKAVMKRRRQDTTRLEKDGNCKVKPAFLRTVFKKNRSLFSSAFEYTLEFCNEHYTQSTIFNKLNYSPNEWQLLNHDQLEKYLPKSELSCEVSRKAVKNIDKISTSDQTFKRYELFERQQDDSHTTIYCGGPILALAWLPTPHMYLQCKQVLAVVAGNGFDNKYTVNSNYLEPMVIQFWYFDILKNKMKSAMPSLMFCLAVDIGPVWHLEWCPSGCYNEDRAAKDSNLTRMGLLAVAGSDSTVHVYAVPFLNQDQMGLVYKAKPLLKLKLLEDEKQPKWKYFPTRISWSKASGHRYLSVGYTNGMVAIFDLETSSRLLKFKDESDVDVLLPYNTIKAHKHYISVLSMIHLKGGTNWLLTGSFDRDVSVWDVRNNTNLTMNRKKIVTDGLWFTNWISYINTVEDGATKNRIINASISSHRNYMYEPVCVTSSASSITSVSTSDWLNGIIQCSSVGEISSSFPHQILYCLDSDKTIKYLRYFLGCTKLVSRLESIKDEAEACIRSKPLTYDAASKEYGLVFCDMKMDNYSDFPPKMQERFRGNYDMLELSHPDMYPIQAINKISLNPNCQASLYYAAGYQAGFVRLTYLKFLENDRQVV